MENCFSEYMQNSLSKDYGTYSIIFDKEEFNKTMECSLLEAIRYAESKINENNCQSASIEEFNFTVAWTCWERKEMVWGLY